MTKIELDKLIVPRVLPNTNQNFEYGDSAFDTTDYIWLPSDKDFKPSNGEIVPTDYAAANYGDKGTKTYFLRSAYGKYNVHNVYDEVVKKSGSMTYNVGIRPEMYLDVASVLAIQSEVPEFGKIEIIQDENGRDVYHGIQFGEFPKSKASESESRELQTAFESGRLEKTGKKYTGYMRTNYRTERGYARGENEEYLYKGQKYVLAKTVTWYDSDSVEHPGKYEWFKVEPLMLEIKNWEDLPTSINPRGNGTAEVIDAQTRDICMEGIPFYPKGGYDFGIAGGEILSTEEQNNGYFWQNSCIRGYLNGYDVQNIKENGNPKYVCGDGGNWIGEGFIQQAFGQQLELSDELAKLIINHAAQRTPIKYEPEQEKEF